MNDALPGKFIDAWLPKRGVKLHGPKDLVEKATDFLCHATRTKTVLEEIDEGFVAETLIFRNILA